MTTIHTPATLSALTSAERTAALAWIERDGASLRDVAAQLALPADDLLDILTQPHVAAFIEAAEHLLDTRARILARYDDIDARQSLVAIAKNPDADPTTRLRAAITILHGPPPRRSAPSTIPGGPRPDGSTNTRPTSAPPKAPPAITQPTPAQVNSRSEPPPPTPMGNAPARINRAASAPFALHDRAAAKVFQVPRPASPATSGRPP